ncbi:hypothetical protein [Cupriavidus basilensis]|uniref:hypothetical protein n=1 Tax=Cupriavidus basilensis TaxID=68895 RepID=UPI000B2736E8|nr:hypothetical protein [Cupriavidus basilensis]
MAQATQSRPSAVRSSDWVSGLSADQKNRLLQKLKLAQSWIDSFTVALGKRKPPKARIAEHYIAYAPFSNTISVPARMLMEADERLLRIAVAHECGHFRRRWSSLLSRSDIARAGEEFLADRIAMRLTGASLDELVAALLEIATFEPGSKGCDAEQLADRRKLHELAGS